MDFDLFEPTSNGGSWLHPRRYGTASLCRRRAPAEWQDLAGDEVLMFYAYFYRLVMKLAHRYNWHYAPSFGPLEDGSYQHWCQWCGLRYTLHPAIMGDKLLKER